MELENFRKYLESKNKIWKSHIPFYLKWVSDFILFCNGNLNRNTLEIQIDSFLKDMGKKNEKWQIDQAKEAVQLYCYFIDKNHKISPITDNGSIDDWKIASDTMVRMLRLKQRAYSTEQTYLKWLRDFYVFVKPISPNSLSYENVKQFLSYLAADRHVAKSTQNQAFNALLFFYRHVLDQEVGSINNVVRAKRGQRLPIVLSRNEVERFLNHLTGTGLLMAKILYGSGLRSNM